MTKLGLFLAKRLVNKSELARKTDLSQYRVHKLTQDDKAHLRAEELYLICLALNIQLNELAEYLYLDVKLAQ